jgi:hypothetical protein
MASERIQRLAKCDKVAGDESGALMDQLVKGMLAVGSRRTGEYLGKGQSF